MVSAELPEAEGLFHFIAKRSGTYTFIVSWLSVWLVFGVRSIRSWPNMETWLLARKMIKWTLLYAKVARGFSDCNLLIHTYTVFWELQRVSCRLLVPFLREKPDMGIQAAVYEDITIYSHQEEVGMWPMDTYGIFELGILLGQKKLDWLFTWKWNEGLGSF